MHSPLSSFENHLPRRVITGRGASQVPRGGMPDQWLEPRLHRKRCWGGGRGLAAAGRPAVARGDVRRGSAGAANRSGQFVAQSANSLRVFPIASSPNARS